MKLYYSPGTCSLSPHIVAREAGIDVALERVALRTKELASGGDFRAVNAKGSVPALQMTNGEVLTEGAVIVQYLADQKPETKLAPAAGTLERYRLQEWLNYIASEIHKGFSPLFNPKITPEAKQAAIDALSTRFTYVDKQLAGRTYLLGDTFTVADAYLFTVVGWSKHTGPDLAPWPTLKAYIERVGARPAVKAAIEAESAK